MAASPVPPGKNRSRGSRVGPGGEYGSTIRRMPDQVPARGSIRSLMMRRWISLVPSKIVVRRASRQ